MQDIFRREVVPFCNLSPPHRLLTALPFHDLRALISELDSRRRMDCIVNTSVAGNKASQHLAVCRIYYAVCGKPCDIPLPDRHAVCVLNPRTRVFIRYCRDVRHSHDSLCGKLFFQKGILLLYILFRGGSRPPHVHKASEEHLLFKIIRRFSQRRIPVVLLLQISDQAADPFFFY